MGDCILGKKAVSEEAIVSRGRRSPDIDRPNMSEEETVSRGSPQIDRPDMPMRRMVLVGKTGAGKSSSGNTILGRMGFKAAKSGSSITKECWKETELVAETQVVLVDTPGLFDTTFSERDLKRELSKCISMTAPGPHAIILVIQLGPFTMEEHLAIEKIRAIFGEEADKYTMILFTHGDEFPGAIEEHLEKAPKQLKRLLELCGRRYHVFDNNKTDDRTQVLKFLNKVEHMLALNGGEYYSSVTLQEVDRKLKAKEKELQILYEHKLKMQEQELEERFKEERRILLEKVENLEASNQELKQLIKIQEQELNEYRRFYNRKRKCVREEAEQTEISENITTEISCRLKNII